MEVIRHQNELMQKIRFAMRKKVLEKQPRPRLCTKQRARLPRLRCNEVRLRVVRCVLSRRFQNLPSAAKAAFRSAGLAARLKSCPFKSDRPSTVFAATYRLRFSRISRSNSFLLVNTAEQASCACARTQNHVKLLALKGSHNLVRNHDLPRRRRILRARYPKRVIAPGRSQIGIRPTYRFSSDTQPCRSQ